MTTTPIGGTELLGFAASLIVVLGAILFLGWLYSRAKFTAGGSGDVINIIASRALGAKERLMLVEIAGKQLLVGMTPNHVQTLHVFDAPVAKPKGKIGRPAKNMEEIPGLLEDPILPVFKPLTEKCAQSTGL